MVGHTSMQCSFSLAKSIWQEILVASVVISCAGQPLIYK